MPDSSSRRTVRIAVLLTLWYSSSIVTSLTTKSILREFPFPIGVALVQQAMAASLSYVSWRWQLRAEEAEPPELHRHSAAFAPIAIVMVMSLVSYRWCLLSVSVSFAHTMKTLGPLFTIVFSRVLLQERLPASRYLSVLPVVLGVAIATSTEVEFAPVGFACAVVSTVCQALQMVLAKRVLGEASVSKAELFCVAAVYAFLMLVPLFAALEAWWLRTVSAEAWRHTARWMLINGLASFANQFSGLSVLDEMSSPLSHALANVMKRAAVISMAFVVANRPVTPLHLCGVGMSVFGTLVYRQLDHCRPDRVTSDGYELVPLTEAADASPADDPEAPQATGETKLDPG